MLSGRGGDVGRGHSSWWRGPRELWRDTVRVTVASRCCRLCTRGDGIGTECGKRGVLAYRAIPVHQHGQMLRPPLLRKRPEPLRICTCAGEERAIARSIGQHAQDGSLEDISVCSRSISAQRGAHGTSQPARRAEPSMPGSDPACSATRRLSRTSVSGSIREAVSSCSKRCDAEILPKQST
jgi:hypothetical protein